MYIKLIVFEFFYLSLSCTVPLVYLFSFLSYDILIYGLFCS